VIAFTKVIGKELADTNIRVNAIAPGAIDTDILRQLSPDDVASLVEKSPVRRLGTVEEVAALALWLCSEECSFSTGATFDVSGGESGLLTAYRPHVSGIGVKRTCGSRPQGMYPGYQWLDHIRTAPSCSSVR
jgi:hypothetical protein